MLLVPRRAQALSAQAFSSSATTGPPAVETAGAAKPLTQHFYATTTGAVGKEVATLLGWKSEEKASKLVEFGAVWHQQQGMPKPRRVTDSTTQIEEGDLLRIYANPRRYETPKNILKHVLVIEPDFLLLDKPAGLPCHAMVDNLNENVLACLSKALPDTEELRLGHRLDTDTSGLLVVSRSQEFLKWFGGLLREGGGPQVGSRSGEGSPINKYYRALVRPRHRVADPAALPSAGHWYDGGASYREAVEAEQSQGKQQQQQQQQQQHQHQQQQQESPRPGLLTQYLLPSKRSPKLYRKVHEAGEGWAECRMNVVSVKDYVLKEEPVSASVEAGDGSQADVKGGDDDQAQAGAKEGNSSQVRSFDASLWGTQLHEVEVQLLTGRTHQIRGMFGEEGFPIAGDALYAQRIEATELDKDGKPRPPSAFAVCPNLALQACKLSFPRPPWLGEGTFSFALERAWWHDLVKEGRPLE